LGDRRNVDDEAVAHFAALDAPYASSTVWASISSIAGAMSCSAQKSSISWVSGSPPIADPARLRRAPISVKAPTE
jgi:hypothetical protein